MFVSEHNSSYDPLNELSLLLMSCTGTPQLNAGGLQRKTKKDNRSKYPILYVNILYDPPLLHYLSKLLIILINGGVLGLVACVI